MLDELVSTVESLTRRIQEHRSYFDEGAPEARTRVSLIDPLLQVLGWNVADPSQVEIEPRMAQGRADYALRGRAGEPVLLLEARRLADTNVPYEQIAAYVVGQNMRRSVKIPYCAVTNGSRWLVFDVFDQSIVLDVSIEREDPRRCALRLLRLWQSTLGDLGVVEQPTELRTTGEPKDSRQNKMFDMVGVCYAVGDGWFDASGGDGGVAGEVLGAGPAAG